MVGHVSIRMSTMSQSSESSPKRNLSTRFWDMYGAKGATAAMVLLAAEFEFDNKRVQQALPDIMKEATRRKVPLDRFLKEFEDATGVTDDGGGISSDGDNEDHLDQDADGASQARNDDGEDQDGREDSKAGSDV